METGDAGLKAVHEAVEAYWNKTNEIGFNEDNPVVRLHEPTFGPEEINAALDCLLSTYVTMGPKVKAFEAEYAKAFGWKHAVMVNSGSSANLLAVAALTNPRCENGLRPGDEVIVPALSWSTTVWPLVQCGLVPVIVDIDPDTLNIDPGEIEKAIGPRTRGVMIVPVYGNPCDMDAIADICQRHDLVLIEDCCESLGATYRGKPVGQFGRVSTFSFYFSHHITTLEGGICVTDDFELAELMRILRAHGWIREVEDPERWVKEFPGFDKKFLFVNSGYNLRATELQGAIGSVQLRKLGDFVTTRRANAAWFSNALSEFSQTLSFQKETENGQHSWFGFPVFVAPDAPYSREELTEFLESARIETRPIICGNIAEQPGMKLYPHRTVGDLRHANNVMQNAFSFGIHQDVGDAARAYIMDQFRRFHGSNT